MLVNGFRCGTPVFPASHPVPANTGAITGVNTTIPAPVAGAKVTASTMNSTRPKIRPMNGGVIGLKVLSDQARHQ